MPKVSNLLTTPAIKENMKTPAVFVKQLVSVHYLKLAARKQGKTVPSNRFDNRLIV